MSGKTSILRSRDCECEDELDEDNFTRHYLSNRTNDAMPNILPSENGSDSETEYNSNDNDLDSIDTFDPDYNLQYEIDNFPDELDPEKENLEMEDKMLIDSLADPEAELQQQAIPDAEYLNPETMSKHRPSFEVLQKSLSSSNERIAPPEVIITVLTSEPKTDASFSSTIYSFQKAINNTPTGWEKLCEENDLETLTVLLWSWFENLDSPILNNETISQIADSKEDGCKSFFSLDTETRFTLEYLARFVMRLCEQQEDGKRLLVARIVSALTIKRVQLADGNSIPKQKQTWLALSSRSREAIFSLLYTLMEIIASGTPA